ncbi:hypothetical protein E9993_04155 [Labilibacter sediminis]|nr:hypothetical protein E9993_04155 [Labilibacter sediminis]
MDLLQKTRQEKAKAFWFFSYACNGMNVKNIANIKYKDFIDVETFFYYRNKIEFAEILFTNRKDAEIL